MSKVISKIDVRKTNDKSGVSPLIHSPVEYPIVQLNEEILTIDLLLNDLLDSLCDLHMGKYTPRSVEYKDLHKLVEIKINNLRMNVSSPHVTKIFLNMDYRNYEEACFEFNVYKEDLEALELGEPLSINSVFNT